MKLYVGNLNYQTTEEELEELFSQYGEIKEIILIKDRETGRPKGFGFITFETEEAMQAALEKNGEDVKGRNIRVNKAEERKERPKSNFNYR